MNYLLEHLKALAANHQLDETVSKFHPMPETLKAWKYSGHEDTLVCKNEWIRMHFRSPLVSLDLKERYYLHRMCQ